MKIALQVGAPEAEQLTQFMQSYAETDTVNALQAALSAGSVIAAYDSGRLVGVGSRIPSSGSLSDWRVVLAPGYERRGIGDHMAKLLLPKNERLHDAG